MNKPLLALILLASLSCPAAVPLSWTVETSRATPATFEAYQGETIEFSAALQSGGKPLAAPSDYSLYWQTNGMGNAWWSAPCTPPATPTNVLFATWSPTNEVGARAYNCFIGKPGSIYHAAFQLRLRPSPGATPNELPLPRKVIDFATVTVLNPPWPEDGTSTNTVNDLIASYDSTNLTARIAAKTSPSDVANIVTNDIPGVEKWVFSGPGYVEGHAYRVGDWLLPPPAGMVFVHDDTLGETYPANADSYTHFDAYFSTGMVTCDFLSIKGGNALGLAYARDVPEQSTNNTGYAANADRAIVAANADRATEADHSTSSDSAAFAQSAAEATHAQSATYSDYSGYANNAISATSAYTATQAGSAQTADKAYKIESNDGLQSISFNNDPVARPMYRNGLHQAPYSPMALMSDVKVTDVRTNGVSAVSNGVANITLTGGSGPASSKRYAMFIINLNPSGRNYLDFELKASTNNFAETLFFCASGLNGNPLGGQTNDCCRLYTLSARLNPDVRAWTQIASTRQTEIRDCYLPEIVVIVDKDITKRYRHEVGWDWLREDNDDLIWSYVRIGMDEPEMEPGKNKQQWRPIMPVKWLDKLPAWAQKRD